jgi:hypothetical protein
LPLASDDGQRSPSSGTANLAKSRSMKSSRLHNRSVSYGEPRRDGKGGGRVCVCV